jgi:hypothetical protein
VSADARGASPEPAAMYPLLARRMSLLVVLIVLALVGGCLHGAALHDFRAGQALVIVALLLLIAS